MWSCAFATPLFLASQDVDGILILAGFAAVAIIGVGLAARLRQRVLAFQEVAAKNGFTFVSKSRFVQNWRPVATHSTGPRPMEIREELAGSADSEERFQELTVRPAATGDLEFLFRPKNRWRKLEPAGEARRVPFRDEAFDAAWFVETNQPALLREALTAELRARFSRLLQPTGLVKIELRHGLLVFRDANYFAPPERFEEILQLAATLAGIAEDYAGKRKST